MGKREPVVRLVPVRIPGTARFKVKAVLIDPETRERVKGKKTKSERRRIRKKYEAQKKPRRSRKPEVGRAIRYAGKKR